MGFLLFITAYILLFPLTIVNLFYVEKTKGYFKNTAKNIDVFANIEFRAFWNKTLRTEKGYPFGIPGETISSALGKNQIQGTLTKRGKFLVELLDTIDENHSINSIDINIMGKLNQPTPKRNTLLWKIGSFVYALVILLNENFSMVAALGLEARTEASIKIAGVFIYFLFTYFNFKQTLSNLNPTP